MANSSFGWKLTVFEKGCLRLRQRTLSAHLTKNLFLDWSGTGIRCSARWCFTSTPSTFVVCNTRAWASFMDRKRSTYETNFGTEDWTMDATWLPKRPTRRDSLCAQACGFGTCQRDSLEIQEITLMEATPYEMTLFHGHRYEEGAMVYQTHCVRSQGINVLGCKVLSSPSEGLLITPIATHYCTWEKYGREKYFRSATFLLICALSLHKINMMHWKIRTIDIFTMFWKFSFLTSALYALNIVLLKATAQAYRTEQGPEWSHLHKLQSILTFLSKYLLINNSGPSQWFYQQRHRKKQWDEAHNTTFGILLMRLTYLSISTGEGNTPSTSALRLIDLEGGTLFCDIVESFSICAINFIFIGELDLLIKFLVLVEECVSSTFR